MIEPIGKVRLIGVDTPETVDPRRPVQQFGKEASDFTKRMVEGRRVRTLLNSEIIRQGFGFAYTRFPFKFLKEFRKIEREAREHGRGLWGLETRAAVPAQPKAHQHRAKKYKPCDICKPPVP